MAADRPNNAARNSLPSPLDNAEKENLQKTVKELDGKLRREIAWRQTLTDVTDLLASNWDILLVFPTISARIRRLLLQEFASLCLYDSQARAFVRKGIDFPLGKGLLASTPISAKNSPAERALQKKVPLIFSKKGFEEFDAESVRSFLAEGLQSLCWVPMIRPQGPLGILLLGSTRADAFKAEDLTLLSQVASQMALAMENHRAAGA